MMTQDAIDELAALFLTPVPEGGRTNGPAHDDSRDGARMAPKANASTMELVLVGHLPVRAGVWLGPYADAVARERGCTGLIRLDREEPAVQVMRGVVGRINFPVAGLRELIASLAPQVNNWLIRPPHDVPVEDVAALGADRITILSSADSAAVVAAYQIVKTLAAAAADCGAALPPIGVAVLGSNAEHARRVVDRINQAAASFLNTRIELALCLPRMDADIRCTRDIRLAGEACSSAAEVARWIGETSKRRCVETSKWDNAHEGGLDARPPRLKLVESEPVEEPEGVAASPFVETMRIKLAPKAAVDAAARGEAAPTARGRERASGTAATDDDDAGPVTLASHVAGLRPLPIRCPSADQIEIAVDDAGELHLLGRESLLRDLRIAEAWAKSHRSILAMAARHEGLKAAGSSVLHIFTDRPHTLADLHGAGLRLHVLAPVTVEGRTGWYAAPLNG